MNKIILIMLLTVVNSASAGFFVMGYPDQTRASSPAEACAALGAYKKLDYQLSSSISPTVSPMPNYSCRIYGSIGGWPTDQRYTVHFEGCSSGSELNEAMDACVPISKCTSGTPVPLSDLQPPVSAIKCANDNYNYEGCLVVPNPDWDSTGVSMGVICIGDQNFCTGHFIMTGQETSCSASNDEDDDKDDDKLKEDECPSGYIWTGTTCIADNSGDDKGGEDNGSDNKDDDNNNGSGGGNNSGGSDGGSGGGSGSGSGNGSGNSNNGSDDGNGSGGGGGGGSGNGDGEGEGNGKPYNKQFEKGDSKGFGGAGDEWDKKIADGKKELQDKIDELYSTIEDDLVIRLPEGWGSLPCYNFSVPFYNASMNICLADYEADLSLIRYALIFIASVFAAYVILR